MTDQEQRNREIDNQIAENEAKRVVVSQTRVSIWAVIATVIIALIVVLLYVAR